MKEGFNIKGIDKKARTIMEQSLIIIGNEAKNHFVKSFEIQGFQDAVTERWKPRKKIEKGKRRAILVKSGDLRRSIKRERVNKFRLEVLISSDLPYAKIHNEGLSFNVASRKGSGTITRKVRGSGGFINGKFTKGRATKVKIRGAEYTTGSYSVDMPKRQFIGNSRILNTKLKYILNKRLEAVFK